MRSKEEIYNKLRELRDAFDECGYHDTHDLVYYQISGMNEDWDDMSEDLLKSLNELTDSLEAYIKWINTEPEVNWIYG
jgi:chaperonin cofactor prefoldin